MGKIGVIGDRDSILGFKAVGFDIFEAVDAAEAAKALHDAVISEYAVLYITEQVASTIIDDIDRYKESQFPAIIPIPGNAGMTELGMMNVKKSVERAIGADIIFNN